MSKATPTSPYEEMKAWVREHAPVTEPVHPFIDLVNKGEVPIEQLRAWWKDLYYFIRGFPKALAALLSNCDDETLRAALLKNLVDELGQNTVGAGLLPPHPQLFQEAGTAIGIPDGEMERDWNNPTPATREFLNGWVEACKNLKFEAAMSAGALLEGAGSTFFSKAAEGFGRHYGVSERQLRYFRIHETADTEEEHGHLAALVEDAMKDPRTLEETWQAIKLLTRVYTVHFDHWYRQVKGEEPSRKSAATVV